MGKTYDVIDRQIADWIGKQKIFFVATAPLTADGMVNCSPKGGDTLRVLDERTLIYLEYGGSGIETIAHIRDNGRMVIMLCAFEGPPKIFRFHGAGEVIARNNPDFKRLFSRFDTSLRGVRSIIKLNVERIADSCGYGVPLYDFRSERPSMANYIEKTDDTRLRAGLRLANSTSLDGLPGISEDEIVAMTPEAADADSPAGGD